MWNENENLLECPMEVPRIIANSKCFQSSLRMCAFKIWQDMYYNIFASSNDIFIKNFVGVGFSNFISNRVRISYISNMQSLQSKSYPKYLGK